MPWFGRAPSARRYVLLVDDEPAIRETVTRFLERSGYAVRAVRSVPEAMQSIGPDLGAVILDVILVNSGGRSGIDVLAEIRRRPGGGDVPILMLTGYGLNPDVLAAIECHGAELLHKPVPMGALAAWLKSTTFNSDITEPAAADA